MSQLSAKIILWIGVLAGSFVLSLLVSILLRIFERKKHEKEFETAAMIVRMIRRRSLYQVLILIALAWIVNDIPSTFPQVDLRVIAVLNKIIVIVAIIFGARLVDGILDTMWIVLRDRLQKRREPSVVVQFFPLVRKISDALVILIAVMIILAYLGINISALVVSMGVAGAAVALAVKDTIENTISGILIMFDRPFRIGDRIQLSSGDVGDVVEIGLRSTKILTFDNNLIIIPNKQLIQQKIVNLSYPNATIRVRVDVGVAYGTDTRKAREIMEQVAREHPKVLDDPAPKAFVSNLGDSAINLTLFARVGAYSDAFFTEKELTESIYQKFGEEGIEIPFPQIDVHMKTDNKNG